MEPAALLSPNSTALHAIVIQLSAADQGKLPATLGRAIHAQVLHWFGLGNPAVAAQIHPCQDSPLCLSDLLGRRQAIARVGDRFHFRISLLNGDLLPVLLSGLEQWGTQAIELGKFPFVIRSIETLPGGCPWVSSSDYRLLAKTLQPCDDLRLRFLSPTSFKVKQFTQPFPLPELVFGNLLRRWNAFAPPELKFSPVEWQGLVSAYDLKTEDLKMKSPIEIGAQGWVRYRFLHPEQAKIATVLAHFAFFSGVGRKTAMGMGQTRLEH